MLKAFVKSVALGAVTVFAALTLPAAATVVTLSVTDTNNGPYGGVFGDYSFSGVNVTGYNGVGGAFDLTSTPGGRFVAFCVDLSQFLILPSQYTTSATLGTPNTTRQDNLERLFETAFSTLDLNNGAQTGGFQLAIWEIVYETGALDLLGLGSFNSSASAATTAGQGFLAGLTGPITQNYELTYYLSGTGQDVVSATPVPVPAAGLLLLAALGGLGLVRRRKPV